jgi:transposase InsO family protein
MKTHGIDFAVSRMCIVLGVSRSGYYSWKKRGLSNREKENTLLVKKILRIYHASNGVYGSPKITVILNSIGYKCSFNRVAKLMQKNGIRSKIVKKYKFKSKIISADTACENILDRNFKQSTINTIWTTDITYIPVKSGFVYLCVFLDLASKKIVGWSVSNKAHSEMVIDALNKACQNQNVKPGLIIHSDQGSQYGSIRFKNYLKNHNFVQSMSRRGNCLDNACVESFFKSIKVEVLNDYRFKNIEEVKFIVFRYIEYFYNRKRIHSSIGYKTPIEYEKNCYA